MKASTSLKMSAAIVWVGCLITLAGFYLSKKTATTGMPINGGEVGQTIKLLLSGLLFNQVGFFILMGFNLWTLSHPIVSDTQRGLWVKLPSILVLPSSWHSFFLWGQYNVLTGFNLSGGFGSDSAAQHITEGNIAYVPAKGVEFLILLLVAGFVAQLCLSYAMYILDKLPTQKGYKHYRYLKHSALGSTLLLGFVLGYIYFWVSTGGQGFWLKEAWGTVPVPGLPSWIIEAIQTVGMGMMTFPLIFFMFKIGRKSNG